jgi:hypothetical protein
MRTLKSWSPFSNYIRAIALRPSVNIHDLTPAHAKYAAKFLPLHKSLLAGFAAAQVPFFTAVFKCT